MKKLLKLLIPCAILAFSPPQLYAAADTNEDDMTEEEMLDNSDDLDDADTAEDSDDDMAADDADDTDADTDMAEGDDADADTEVAEDEAGDDNADAEVAEDEAGDDNADVADAAADDADKGAMKTVAAVSGDGGCTQYAKVKSTLPQKIYAELDIQSEVIGSIPRGVNTCILSFHDAWHKVSYNGLVGFSAAKYFAPSELKTVTASASTGAADDDTDTAAENGDGECTGQGTVAARRGLRVRSEASLEGDVLGGIPNGETVCILGREGAWLQVRFGEISGYSAARYIQAEAAGADDADNEAGDEADMKSAAAVESDGDDGAADDAACTGEGAVTARRGLRIRSEASLDGDILGGIPNGETVCILGTEGEWLNVRFGEITGYAAARFVDSEAAGDGAGETSEADDDEKDTNMLSSAAAESEDMGDGATGEEAACTGDATVTTPSGRGLRIRSEASLDAEIIGGIPSGESACVLANEGKWLQVRYGGVTGYAAARFFGDAEAAADSDGASAKDDEGEGEADAEGGDEASEDTPCTGQQGTVETRGNPLRIRAEANLDADVVGKIPHGASVCILGGDGPWLEVRYEGVSGYSSARFVVAE